MVCSESAAAVPVLSSVRRVSDGVHHRRGFRGVVSCVRGQSVRLPLRPAHVRELQGASSVHLSIIIDFSSLLRKKIFKTAVLLSSLLLGCVHGG